MPLVFNSSSKVVKQHWCPDREPKTSRISTICKYSDSTSGKLDWYVLYTCEILVSEIASYFHCRWFSRLLWNRRWSIIFCKQNANQASVNVGTLEPVDGETRWQKCCWKAQLWFIKYVHDNNVAHLNFTLRQCRARMKILLSVCIDEMAWD